MEREVFVAEVEKSEKITINSPDKLPDPSVIEEWNEPYAKVNFIIPHDGIGPVMKIWLGSE